MRITLWPTAIISLFFAPLVFALDLPILSSILPQKETAPVTFSGPAQLVEKLNRATSLGCDVYSSGELPGVQNFKRPMDVISFYGNNGEISYQLRDTKLKSASSANGKVSFKNNDTTLDIQYKNNKGHRNIREITFHAPSTGLTNKQTTTGLHLTYQHDGEIYYKIKLGYGGISYKAICWKQNLTEWLKVNEFPSDDKNSDYEGCIIVTPKICELYKDPANKFYEIPDLIKKCNNARVRLDSFFSMDPVADLRDDERKLLKEGFHQPTSAKSTSPKQDEIDHHMFTSIYRGEMPSQRAHEADVLEQFRKAYIAELEYACNDKWGYMAAQTAPNNSPKGKTDGANAITK